MKSLSGSISPVVFSLIFFLSVMIASVFLLVKSQDRLASTYLDAITEDSQISELLAIIVEHSSSTFLEPANSAFDEIDDLVSDEILQFNEESDTDFALIEVTDISSRLNLNIIHPNLLETEPLLSRLQFVGMYQEFIDLRQEIGFTVDVSVYEDVIPVQKNNALVTAFGICNINVAYPLSIRELVLLRTGDEDFADLFLSEVQSKLSQLSMWTQEELDEAFEQYYPQLSPIIHTQAMLNVNTLEEDILKSILYYPYGGQQIPEYQNAYSTIIQLRRNQEITPELLEDILNTDEVIARTPLAHRASGYLGTRTWFWQIAIASQGHRYTAILFRDPSSQTLQVLRLVKEYIALQ